MPEAVRRCPVCLHPSVLAINAAILNGKAYRAIARDFKIGSGSGDQFKPDHKKVSRHAEGCMATSYQQVQQEGLSVQGRAIQERLKYLDDQVDVALKDALEGRIVMVGDAPMLTEEGEPQRERSTQDLRVILAAVREGRHNQALMAKLAGALPEGDDDAVEKARKALENPEVRALVVQMEEVLAREAAEAGDDLVT